MQPESSARANRMIRRGMGGALRHHSHGGMLNSLLISHEIHGGRFEMRRTRAVTSPTLLPTLRPPPCGLEKWTEATTIRKAVGLTSKHRQPCAAEVICSQRSHPERHVCSQHVSFCNDTCPSMERKLQPPSEGSTPEAPQCRTAAPSPANAALAAWRCSK